MNHRRVKVSNDPARYAAYAATVKRPGKFEGEAVYVPYFWEAFLDGMAEWEPERNGTLANLLMRFYEAGLAAQEDGHHG